MYKTPAILLLVYYHLAGNICLRAQPGLLLNGGFDDINICSEYQAECGVEGWFYLRDVKVQLLRQEETNRLTGSNSLAIFYTWNGYTGFTPVIGTILPCRLQTGKGYTFRGVLTAKLNTKLNFKPGICLGEKFYVPRRPFSAAMKPDSILQLEPIAGSPFIRFTYHFTATGHEQYLTFGSFIHRDSLSGKTPLTGVQTVSLQPDGFELVPDDPEETVCPAWVFNRDRIYAYNYRHREMDYSLFGKGELVLTGEWPDTGSTTVKKQPLPQAVEVDTLLLRDLLFDFNKAGLKPEAEKILHDYFTPERWARLDSLYIEGHTDSIGSDKLNMQLSQERTGSVRNWFAQQSFSSMPLIRLRAFGRSRPVTGNQTAADRARNRRVELILFYTKGKP